ncbi:hypothetical protein ACWED2_04755 [Amycolatopsis sp. NPDC005003]
MAAIVGGLLAFGIGLRLLVGILQPVLPGELMSDLAAGFDLFFSIVRPGLVPLIAVGALCAVGWIILGVRR